MNFEESFIGSAAAQTTSPAPSPQPKGGGTFGLLFPMLVVFVIFYFLLIRPQARQRKAHQRLLQNLKKGDEVVTTAGIHGRLEGINNALLTVEIAPNVRIKLDKHQVASIKTSPPAS